MKILARSNSPTKLARRSEKQRFFPKRRRWVLLKRTADKMKSLANRGLNTQKSDPLRRHLQNLTRCEICPQMHRPPVSGGPIWSKVMLIGQAPGDKEPQLGRPFAWTAGKTLFGWFAHHCGISEDAFRRLIYM